MEIAIREIIDNKKVDGITFSPVQREGDVAFSGFSYENKSKYEKGSLGHRYHILLYKLCEDGFVIGLDLFEATLTDPTIYIKNIIDCGFYGIVFKKTKKSQKIANELFKKYKMLGHEQNN
jgi:hypothetical protein